MGYGSRAGAIDGIVLVSERIRTTKGHFEEHYTPSTILPNAI